MSAGRATGRVTIVLTIAEAAEELRISENSMYRLIAAGDVQTVDVGTGRQSRARVPRKELERYVDAHLSARPVRDAS